METIGKFILNLLGPIVGLLKLGDIIFEHKWGYIPLWLFIPVIFGLWRSATLDNLQPLVFLWIMLAVYGALWLVFSIQDSIAIKAHRILKGLLYALVLLIPGWVVVFFTSVYPAMGGIQQSFFLRVNWGVYLYLICISVTIIGVLVSVFNASNKQREKWPYWIFPLAPMAGIHGLYYLAHENLVRGVLILLFGWGLILAMFWATGVSSQHYGINTLIFSYVVMYLGPAMYFFLWLWPVVDARFGGSRR